MSTPRLFVAGATGYTGRALVPLACRRGWAVTAHVRPGSSSLAACGPAFEQEGARVVEVAWDEDAIAAAVAEAAPTIVYGLLGTSAPRRKEAKRRGESDDYESVDRDLTLMLWRACQALDPKPRFVYLSSLGADRPTGAYLRVRQEVEAALKNGDVPWTVARPSFITGPDRPDERPGERMTAKVADSALGLLAAVGITGPRDQYASMTADELARALLAAGAGPFAGKVLETTELRGLAG